jgi:hypothetical protein
MDDYFFLYIEFLEINLFKDYFSLKQLIIYLIFDHYYLDITLLFFFDESMGSLNASLSNFLYLNKQFSEEVQNYSA